jgi:spore germination cell wall hydrolase CwlJ-like protein
MKLQFLLWLASLAPHPVHEQACLAATVYLEARDQPAVGQSAVAEVVLRRRESGNWGSTVCDVVMQHKQFATTLGTRARWIKNPKAWNRAWAIAGASLAMWKLPPAQRQFLVPGADHFFAHNVVDRPAWARGEPVATIGGHTFHRVRGAVESVGRSSALGSMTGG